MLNRYKHVNSKNEELDFLKLGIFVNESEIRDYKWTYETENGKIKKFKREPKEFTIPFIFVTDLNRAEEIKDMFYEHFDVDVINKSPGYFEINGYTYSCYAIESVKSNYLAKKNMLTINVKFVSDNPVWIKSTIKSFDVGSGQVVGNNDGIDFPFDFPFDFPKTFKDNIIINDCISDCEFEMTIYGMCENPQIVIGENIYQINNKIDNNEYVVINSSKRTITKYNIIGESTNWFKFRDSSSIFKKIPKGENIVSWSNDFGFDIKMIDERGEPKWS